MPQVLPKHLRDDELYDCTYLPGLNERRWNASWRDGVARNVPGEIVRSNLVGTVSPLGIFPRGTVIQWRRGRPVEALPTPPSPAAPADPPKAKKKAKKKPPK
jgi:hypothetical protein